MTCLCARVCKCVVLQMMHESINELESVAPCIQLTFDWEPDEPAHIQVCAHACVVRVYSGAVWCSAMRVCSVVLTGVVRDNYCVNYIIP